MENNGNNKTVIKVGIVEDHVLVANGYVVLLNGMKDMRVTLQAHNGQHLLDLLKTMNELPDILLMDVDMKIKNGIIATKEVTDLYPAIKVIAVSAKDDAWTIRQMIGVGACAYLSKEVSTEQMERAIREVHNKGKYHADLYHMYSTELYQYNRNGKDLSFTEKEIRFLQLLCEGYSYARISEEMKVSVDSVDYYSACISRKLNTKSQVIMAFEALRMGIIRL